MPSWGMVPLILLLSAASLFAAGREIDPGKPVATPYQIRNVSVASSGSGFLTTWLIETYRGGMHTWGVSADANGRLDSAPRPLIPYGRPRALRPAGDGERYQFDWGDDFGSYRSLLSGTGDVQSTTRIPNNAPASSPRVELLNFSTNFSMGLRRYDREGALLPPGDIVLVPLTKNLRIISSSSLSIGDKTLVLWSSGTDSYQVGGLKITDQRLDTALVEADGTISHRTSLPFGRGPDLGTVRLAFANKTIIALFSAGRFPLDQSVPSIDILALRLDSQGRSIDQAPTTIVTGRGLMEVAANDTVIFLVTFEPSVLFIQLWSHAVTLDATGFHVALPEFLTPMPTDQDAPSIASDGVNFLSVWTEKSGLSETVRFALNTPDRMRIASGDLMQVKGFLGQHTVAFGGGQYLVVWHHFRQIWMQRISMAGVTIDPAPVKLQESSGGSFFTMASDGNKFLIASEGVQGVLVGADLSVVSLGSLTPPLSSPQAPHPAFPSLAWDGSQYVMTYNLIPQSSDNYIGRRVYDVAAVRIARDGTPMDSKETVLIPLASNPRIASNGHGLLVVAAGFNGIQATMVTSDSTSLHAGPVITLSPLSVGMASLAATTDGYLVGWRNQGFSNYSLGPIPSFLGARHVSFEGTVGPLLSVETGPPDLETPAVVATNARGDALVEISEIRTPAMSPRVTAYTPAELLAITVPPAPMVVTTTNGLSGVIVQWTANPDDGARGYIVTVTPLGSIYPATVHVRAGARSAVLPTYFGPAEKLSVRVSAWNGAGISAPSAEATLLTPRRRTVR